MTEEAVPREPVRPAESPTEADESAKSSLESAVQAAPTVLAEAIGGVRGMIDSGLPAVVFVGVAALSTLRTAVIAALGAALVLAGVRVLRHEPLRYAVSGCFGVAVSAFVALRLGKAQGFFLPGIAINAAYGAAFLASIALRRPLVGVVVRALGRPEPRGAAAVATTLLWGGVFLARATVQGTLYLAGKPGWLAAAKLTMGWPLTLLALAITAAAVRRTDGTVGAQNSVGVAGSRPRIPS